MKLSGIGCLRIAKSLNEEGILNFNGKPWQVKLVEKYLKMEQLIGSFQRVSMSEMRMEPSKNCQSDS
ncbi:recombinase family protein [Vibrio splendidus]|nr:recombinase family protein [Vibrio splendidus]